MSTNATNSNFMVEWVMNICFLDFKEIVPPSRINNQPKVDLLSSLLDIQLVLNPSNKAKNLEY